MVTTYSIAGYARIAADRVRTDAYVQALRQAIKPGSVVLDIGTGTGIFALLAARFGARRVYAVEPGGAIELARQTAAANGYAGLIDFIQHRSTKVTLPESADVIISDLHGVLPLFEQLIPTLVDARKRLLAPGGVMIPRQETLWAAVVDAPDLYARHVNPWGSNTYGLDMDVARRLLTNNWTRARVAPEQLLVQPSCWATLNYATAESPNVGGELTWTVTRGGTGHGLCVWFDAMLAPGVSFSNAPGAPELIFDSALFPWSEPLPLVAGDSVCVALRADLVGDDYVWRWETCVRDGGIRERVKASFKQSTFFGAPLSAAHLRKRSTSHVPTLSEEGCLDLFILALMDGRHSLDEIARQVAARFPGRFPRWEDALTKAGYLSVRYGQEAHPSSQRLPP